MIIWRLLRKAATTMPKKKKRKPSDLDLRFSLLDNAYFISFFEKCQRSFSFVLVIILFSQQ